MRVFVITESEPFADGVQIYKVYTDFKKVSHFLRDLEYTNNIRVQVWNTEGSMVEYYAYEGGRLELLWGED
jgi:hypothetical protein